ncbi:MAG: lysophospholipid acyltransferase family protein, partial [Thermoguttaceae bacterium]
MNRKRIVDYLVYVAVRVVICIAQAVRIETGQRIARWIAWLFSDVLRIRANVTEENLLHAFPELSISARNRIMRQMWEHLFLLALEVALTPRKIHETNWRDYVELVNEDRLVRLLLENRPLLIVTGHLGNFEVGGYVLGILGFPSFTVARTLDNPYLDRFVNEFRGRTDQHIIPKNGGADQIEQVLANSGTMTFLADQYAGGKGCWVEFFARPASAHKAIALLALQYNAMMAVSAVTRKDKTLHFQMHNYAMVDPQQADSGLDGIKELTQWYTARLEDLVRMNPEQYWWLHRRWKDTRKPKKKRRQAGFFWFRQGTLELGFQFRQRVEQIGHQAVVGNLENRRVLVL